MLAIFLLALALAMDAVAVAMVQGAVGKRSLARALELGLIFGLAQGVMPLLGWGLGVAFAGLIEAYDHWIAFALLFFLGARMLLAAWKGGGDAEGQGVPPGERPRFVMLLTGALATSIDAAAAGLALSALDAPIAVSCLIIGSVTVVLCTLAYLAGSRTPPGSRRWTEAIGGLILIAIGARILVEHTMG